MHRVIAAALALLPASIAFAQPMVPSEFYDRGTQTRGNSVAFCLWPQSPLAALDRAVATAIAEMQLIEPQFHDVHPSSAGGQEAFEQELFINLMDDCDAVMGGNMSWSPLPDWLSVTAPYFRSNQVLAVTDPAISRLGDLDSGARIGAILYSEADMTLAVAIRAGAVPPLTRIPFDTPRRMLEALSAGDLDAAIVPDYGFAQGVAAGLETLTQASLEGLVLPSESLGILVLSRNTYLRELLSEAIAALDAQGRLEQLALETLSAP